MEDQARQFVDNFKMQMAQQGIPYDQYLKMTGMDEAKLLADAKEPAGVRCGWIWPWPPSSRPRTWSHR